MTKLNIYRKLSIIAMATMTIVLLLSFAAIWNSLLTSEVKHEGWVIIFLALLFLIGTSLFIIAYKTSDASELEKVKKEAYESGKNEILQIGKKIEEVRNAQNIQEEDINKITDTILSGMQGIRTESGFCNKVLVNLAKNMGFVQGIMYIKEKKGVLFNPIGEYAITSRKPRPFKKGENIPGQVAESKSMMILYDIPENYFIVSSGLGNSQPRFLLLVPVLFNEESIAVLELAAFKKPDEITGKILNKVSSELGIRLHKFITA
jgi:hypothetical protein